MGFIARIKDRLFDRKNVIEVEKLEGDIVYNGVSLEELTGWYKDFESTNSNLINLGQMNLENGVASFNIDSIAGLPETGLFILMFNTTCVAIPYTLNPTGVHNRFVCNAIYNNQGESMVVRGYVEVTDTIYIRFDDNFATAITNSGLTLPYGVCKFVKL